MDAHQHSGSCIRRQKLYQNPFRTGSCRSLQPPRATLHRSRECPKTCIPLRQRSQQWSGMPLHRRIILSRGFPGPTEDYLAPRGLSLSGELYISDSPAVFLPSLMMGKDADVQQHNGESTRVDVTWTLRNVRRVGEGMDNRRAIEEASHPVFSALVECTVVTTSSRGKTPKMRFMPLR